MVFRDGGIKAKKASQARTRPQNNGSSRDDESGPAKGVRQRKVSGSSPVSASKDVQVARHPRASPGSCLDACIQTPVSVKSVKSPLRDVSKIMNSPSGSSKLMKPASGSCKYGAAPSSASSSGASRASVDVRSRARSRPSTGGKSESSRKLVCPYTYCSLNDRDRVAPPSIMQFLASRRALAKKGLSPMSNGSDAAGRKSRGQGLHRRMSYVLVDRMREENTSVLGSNLCHKSSNCADDSVNLFAESENDLGLDPAVSACKGTEIDHGTIEFNPKPGFEAIEIPESLLDGLDREASAEDSTKRLTECKDGKGNALSPGMDVSAHDIAEINCYDYPQSEDSDPHCFIRADALGTLCGDHTESDRESAPSIEGQVEEESDSVAGNPADEPVSEISANDCLEQSVECEDDGNSKRGNDAYDYGYTKDSETLCFVRVHTLGMQYSILAKSDRPPGGSVNDTGESYGHEVNAEHIKISGSLLNGSDSEFGIDDSRQFAECNEDGKGDNYRSDSDISGHESIECNDYDHEIKDEYIKISESLLHGSDSEFGVDDSRLLAECTEDGEGSNYRSDSDVSANESIECNDYEHDVKDECIKIAESLFNGSDSVFAIDDSGQLSECNKDGQGSDYGSDSGASAHESIECNDNAYCHGKDSEACCFIPVDTPGIQCSSRKEFNSPLDGSLFELGCNPNRIKDEECTNVEGSVADHLGFENCVNVSIKQLAESQDGKSNNFGADSDNFAHEIKECDDCDYDHSMDNEPWHSIQVDGLEMHCSNQTEPDSLLNGSPFEFPASSKSEVEEDYYNIIAESGLSGSDAEFSPCSRNQVKEYGNIAEENEKENLHNNPLVHSVKFRRRQHGYPFSEPISEAEKVDLRHHSIQERKAAEEWMIDYALTKIVNKLSPFRERKVELLVEAFESVMPISKCDSNDLEHGTGNLSHVRPMQACS